MSGCTCHPFIPVCTGCGSGMQNPLANFIGVLSLVRDVRGFQVNPLCRHDITSPFPPSGNGGYVCNLDVPWGNETLRRRPYLLHPCGRLLHSKLPPPSPQVLLYFLVATSSPPVTSAGIPLDEIAYIFQSVRTYRCSPKASPTQHLVPSGNQGYICNLGCSVGENCQKKIE